MKKQVDNYRAFFCKDNNVHKFNCINVSSSRYLSEAIAESCVHDQLKDGICIYNSSSYMNKQRIYEHANLYKSEQNQKTYPTSALEEKLKQYCKHDMRDWNAGLKAFDRMFNIEAYDYDKEHKIAGNVVLIDFPFNTSHCTLQQHIDRVSQLALLLGYNYVAHELSKTACINGTDYCYASIQFEATYFSSNVKYGDILWHVTPTEWANKILKNGLLPRKENEHGFSYGSRVYCFIDKYDQLFKDYAKSSSKQSKKFILNTNLKDELKSWYELVQEKTRGKLFDTREFAVLSIDTAKLKDTKFFRDNTFDMNGNFIAVYTMQPIPPNAVNIAFTFVA